jgi:hypothetical protein
MRAVLLVGALALAVGALTHSSARAEPAASTLLDVTFDCAVELRGGAYIVEARAHSGTRIGGRWGKLPYAGLRAGNFGGPGGNVFVWATSGVPTATTLIDNEYETFDVKTFGTFGVRRKTCRPTAERVPLAATGLRGGVAAQLGEEMTCFAPRRVVVRIRATLQARGTLRRGPVYLATHAPAREAKLAVRTLAGKPLVYADVSQSGTARLFTAKGCSG